MTNPAGLTARCTILESEVPVNAAFLVTVGAQVGNDIPIDIATGTATRYKLHMWLVDAAATPNEQTTTLPTGDNIIEWHEVTDTNGEYTLTITHTGTHTWYLVVCLGALVVISDAISF